MNFRRTVIVVLCALLACNSVSFAKSVFDDLSSLDKDKYVHFGAGVLISHVSYPIFKNNLRDKDDAALYAILLTALVGLGKEVYDINRTGFDGGDLAATILGGGTILVVRF